MNGVKTTEVSHSATAKVCRELEQQGSTGNSIGASSYNANSDSNAQPENKNKPPSDAADLISGISAIASNPNMNNRNDVHKPLHQQHQQHHDQQHHDQQHHHQQQQQQHGVDIGSDLQKDKQQRIQFTIGKKRRKLPSADQANKRSAYASHHINVLDSGDNANSSPNISPEKIPLNTDDNGGKHFGTVEDESRYDTQEMYVGAEIHQLSNSTSGNIGTMANVSIAASASVEESQAPQLGQKQNETSISTTVPHHRTQIYHHRHHANHSNNQSATVNANTNANPTTPAHAVSTQPTGWRVKLYRLNADGSWDDCGTGRIICLISDNNGVKDKDGNISLNIQGNHEGDKLASPEGKDWANPEDKIYQSLGMPTLCMQAEVPANSQLKHLPALTNIAPKVLLRTRVLVRESYQRQGDNIITWCEPFFLPAQNTQGSDNNHQVQSGSGEDVSCGVDLALSFQDNAGCRDIWNKISKIQHKAYELFEARGGLSIDGGEMGLQDFVQHQSDDNRASSDNGDKDAIVLNNSNGVTSMSSGSENRNNGSPVHGSALHMHSSTNENNHMWSASSDGNSNSGIDGIDDDEHDFMEGDTATAVSMAARAAAQYGGSTHGKNQMLHLGESMDINHTSAAANAQLCDPPTLDNLGKIADIIAASQPQQREAITMFVSQAECAYLKTLLAMFPSAEAKNDYHALATLASIIKSIFLFNEPSIIQLVVSDEQIFEDCCCCLEYDPDLKEKANHRWFIRDRLKFRTVLIMEDEELIDSIHRAFRVTYIRDTLLRPTMDESSLSTLGSLLTFTHGDVVKGVMSAPRNKNASSQDSYLVRILRLLGKEIRAIRGTEWETMGQTGRLPSVSGKNHANHAAVLAAAPAPAQLSNINEQPPTVWKQHLTLQDQSLSSRKLRRRGCLSFLREMFNMVRTSLQQSDKDDFYAVIVLMDVKLHDTPTQEVNDKKVTESEVLETDDAVNLLSLLGAILSDTNADVSERGACLDILSAIASHEPSLIRKHCLDEFSSSTAAIEGGDRMAAITRVARPEPNDKREVVFACPPTDLFLSLLYVMATENDAGIVLQTCEVIRIVLDTEMVNDPTQLDLGGVIDNEEDELIGSDNISFLVGANPSNGHSGGGCEQNSFLQMFYDHYVPWLVAPFQYSILIPKTAVPFSFDKERLTENDSILQFLMRTHQRLKDTKISRTGLLKMVSTSAIRLSFSVELLSFCVRAHCYRMKRYLINSRVLINVMKMLSPSSKVIVLSGDRCLKLGALRCLRSIISLKDEFYNRHIVQHSLFTPVFEVFRANPVGDNLVSSSIIEMCEFIRTENIKSLIEYTVTKHICQTANGTQLSPSSTDTTIVKLPPCLEDLATPYVDTLTLLRQKYEENVSELTDGTSEGDKGRRIGMSEKAMEDQRKFREADEEESYFFDDLQESKF